MWDARRKQAREPVRPSSRRFLFPVPLSFAVKTLLLNQSGFTGLTQVERRRIPSECPALDLETWSIITPKACHRKQSELPNRGPHSDAQAPARICPGKSTPKGGSQGS